MSRAWRQAFAGAALLAGTWAAVRNPTAQRFDLAAGNLLRQGGTPGADRLVRATTDLGSLYATAGTAAALGALGRRDAAADVVALGVLTWCVAQGSKTTVRRSRPYEADGTARLIAPPTGSSYPSGHAAMSGAVTSLLAAHVARPGAVTAFRGLAFYVAATRVYAGVHYPTDVLGGVGLGLLLAAAWRGRIAHVGRGAVHGVGAVGRWLLRPPSRV